jgi:hypothetical protein
VRNKTTAADKRRKRAQGQRTTKEKRRDIKAKGRKKGTSGGDEIKKAYSSKRPVDSRRITISSRAELEGAQTSTCDFLPTSLPTLTGLLTLSSPNASR